MKSRLWVMGGAVAGVAALTVSVGGRSFTPDSSPSASGSGSRSPSVSATTLQDQSAAGMLLPTPVASAAAKADSSMSGGTFEIYGVTRTETSTLLTFSFTSHGGASTRDMNHRQWTLLPTLKTATSTFLPVLYDGQDASDTDPYSAVYNPTLGAKDGVPTPPQTILYPPLPADVTSVTLTGAWFDDVTVPVATG